MMGYYQKNVVPRLVNIACGSRAIKSWRERVCEGLNGVAPDPGIARWQRLLDPLEVRIADGCHLTRAPLLLVQEAGFHMTWSQQRYARGPKPWSYFTVGRASQSGAAH